MASRHLYPDRVNNPILEYFEEIKSGRTKTGWKIRTTYEKLARDVKNGCGDFFYSEERAQHAIVFMEQYCRHSKGKLAGQRVRLMLWERALLAATFGFVDENGNRKHREVFFVVGKKNGKSFLASGVGLYLLTADGEGGPEVYAVATKRDQARIVWGEAKKMVKKSPALAKRVRCLVGEMDADFCEGVFRPLASDSNTLDGLNVHGALMDEIHQWRNGKALYDIIADGVTAREQPLIFMTSTAGVVREDIYDEKYEYAERVINGYKDKNGYKDERFLPIIYELDDRREWKEPEAWIKANPGLGEIKNAQTLAEKVERAKQNPMLVRNLVCKEFNLPETASEAWLNFEQLNNTATFDVEKLHPRYGIGGVDLSKTTDLTSAKVIFRVNDDETIYQMAMYWLPGDLLEKRVCDDKIRYDLWAERGLLRLCDGNKINTRDVTKWFIEIRDKYGIYLPWIGYDAWSATEWEKEMQAEFGKGAMIPVRQGFQTLSAPMYELAADLESKRINYNDNPIDKWCFANTSYKEDENGNIRPIKTTKATRRIDGTCALLDAYAVYRDKKADYLSLRLS